MKIVNKLIQNLLKTHIESSLLDDVYNLPVHITGQADDMICPYISITEGESTPHDVLTCAYTLPLTVLVVTPLANDEGNDDVRHDAIAQELFGMLADTSTIIPALNDEATKTWAIIELKASSFTDDGQRTTAISFDVIAASLN